MPMLKWVTKCLKHIWSRTDETIDTSHWASMVRMPTLNMCDTWLSKRTKHSHQTQEQKKCFTFLIECLMASKFYQTRLSTIKHDQTAPNKVSKWWNVCSLNNVWWCLVTKHFLFVQALRSCYFLGVLAVSMVRYACGKFHSILLANSFNLHVRVNLYEFIVLLINYRLTHSLLVNYH